jgi:hypothetical protein
MITIMEKNADHLHVFIAELQKRIKIRFAVTFIILIKIRDLEKWHI